MKPSRRMVSIALILIAVAGNASSQTKGTPGVYLSELTWTDAEARLKSAPVVILPFGAGAKEHGPHLPMNADYKVAEYLCQRAVESLPVVVAPPIQHGWFPAFREFPGTEVSDAHVFTKYVTEVGRSLIRAGAKRIVILNTGVAMSTGLPLAVAARELHVQTGVPVLLLSWGDLETSETNSLIQTKPDNHAGESETSIHLFLQPNLVHMERAVRDLGKEGGKEFPGYQPSGYSRNPSSPEYSNTGITGDPTKASAEKGKQLLDIMTTQFVKSLRGFSESPLTTTK